jgi:hypothetical protein
VIPHEFLGRRVFAKPASKRRERPVLTHHTKRVEFENLVGQGDYFKKFPKGPLKKIAIETGQYDSLHARSHALNKFPETREKLSLVYGHHVDIDGFK